MKCNQMKLADVRWENENALVIIFRNGSIHQKYQTTGIDQSSVGGSMNGVFENEINIFKYINQSIINDINESDIDISSNARKAKIKASVALWLYAIANPIMKSRKLIYGSTKKSSYNITEKYVVYWV